MKVISPEATQIGRYPLAVLPGQFQDYCRRSASVNYICSLFGGTVIVHCLVVLSLFIVWWYCHIANCLPPTKEEVNFFARVCLLARLLKIACMDLDEMLRVDRCRDMDELMNF